MTTRQEIIDQRRVFEQAQYPTFWGQWDMFRFKCFVLPQALCPALPHFAMQMVADDKTSRDLRDMPYEVALFGVSDSIPEHWRSLIAYHEMVEYLGGYTCPQATVQEMNALMNMEGVRDLEDLKAAWAEYLPYRAGLFRALPKYAEQSGKYTPQKMQEFTQSDLLFRALTLC